MIFRGRVDLFIAKNILMIYWYGKEKYRRISEVVSCMAAVRIVSRLVFTVLLAAV